MKLTGNRKFINKGDTILIVDEPVKEKMKAKISLCLSCHCMTKTVSGRCGKCKEAKDES